MDLYIYCKAAPVIKISTISTVNEFVWGWYSLFSEVNDYVPTRSAEPRPCPLEVSE